MPGEGQALAKPNRSRIYTIYKISKIRSRICRIFKINKRGAGDCSSGVPDPERRKSRCSCPTEVMSARVLNGTARDRPSPYGEREAAFPGP